MKVRLHAGAEADLASAVSFYRDQGGEPLALRFVLEYERVVRLLMIHPTLGTPLARERRCMPLHKFPYMLVYRCQAEELTLLVVRHARRSPRHGQRR